MRVEMPALGRRGEGWVVLQSVVFGGAVPAALAGPPWPLACEPWLRIAGFVLEATGLAVFVASRLTLGPAFTALPRPRDRGTLRSTGVYAHVRHPVYGSLLVAGIGLALQRSPVVFAPAAVLAVVFWLKSIREEAWLVERYPGYLEYRRATPHRFVPWLL